MAQSANDNKHAAKHKHPDDHNHYPFDQMPFAAQFLVWGMRQWVNALKSGQDFASLTGGGFAQFNLAEAGQSLDDLFQVIAVSAQRQIDIRCVKCRWASADEILLLDCVSACQSAQYDLAYAGVLEILPPAAARHVMPSLISLAKLCAHAGLTVTLEKPAAKRRPQVSLGTVEEADRRASRLSRQMAGNIDALEIPALVH
jgi:hypothetical protein